MPDAFTGNSDVQHERPRKYHILKAKVFPTVFHGLTLNFTIPVPQRRKDHGKRAAETVSKFDKRSSEWLSLDIIKAFATLYCQVTDKLEDLLARNWKLHTVAGGSSTCLVLYTVCSEADTATSVARGVKILPDMCAYKL